MFSIFILRVLYFPSTRFIYIVYAKLMKLTFMYFKMYFNMEHSLIFYLKYHFTNKIRLKYVNNSLNNLILLKIAIHFLV